MKLKHLNNLCLKKMIKIISLSVFLICAFARFSNAQEITAIDFNGDIIGKVIPDGNVISLDNKIIGNVTADSFIINEEGTLVGGVVPQGIAIGNDTKVLGKVSNDGSVRLSSGKIIGKALPNGLVVDDYFSILGSVLFPGIVYANNGQTIGRLSGDGVYTDLKGKQIGYVAPTGYAYRDIQSDYVIDGRLISSKMVISNDGEFIGSVVPGGTVSNFDSTNIGRIRANGLVYNQDNNIIGSIVSTGYAFNDKGEYLGYVSYNGEVVSKGNIIGRIKPDKEIVDTNGNHLGFMLDFASTATDFQGGYLGRLIPGGDIVQAKDVVAHVGPKGTVLNKDGKTIGWITKTGSVFDYKGALRGLSLNGGNFVSLQGGNLGNIKKDQAFDTAGRIIGGVPEPKVIFDLNNNSVGTTNIDSSVNIDNSRRTVSPYGYVFSPNGDLIGRAIAPQTIYSINGSPLGRLSMSGSVLGAGSSSLGRFTQSSILIDERNRILGKNIPAFYTADSKGLSLGMVSESNLILDNSRNIVAKALPDNAVVSANSEKSVDLMPKIGGAYSDSLAISVDGTFLGSILPDGNISDTTGSNVGKVSENGITLDNNNSVSGITIPYTPAVGSSCSLIGVVAPDGAIRNYREINVGRPLMNSQVVGGDGAVVGHLVRLGSVLDANGNILGVVSANGQVSNFANENLGCLDKRGRLTNKSGAVIGGLVEYFPVMNFKDEIIGRTTIDGSIVDDGNRFIGYMQPNHNANSRTGQSIGELFKYKVAFDNNNNLLGRVLENADVLDERNEVVGRVDYAGYVINGNQKIGYALYDFYIYDAKDNAIGYITKDGTVLSFLNRSLGKMHKGFIVDQNDKVIGRGNRSYIIRDKNNGLLGFLGIDNKVFDIQNNQIGVIDRLGNVLDDQANILAVAIPLQYYTKSIKRVVVDENGNIIGTLDENGNIVDSSGNVIGYRNTAGKLVDQDGKEIGRIPDRQQVYDNDGRVVGYLNEEGLTIDDNGRVIGRVNDDGTVTDASNNIIGGVGIDWYERVAPRRTQTRPGDVMDIGVSPSTTTDSSSVEGNIYRKSLNIALTPDGEYLGEILDDGRVINKQGTELGTKMPDGLIIDKDGSLIGIAETQKVEGGDIFVPSGTFGKGGAYGIGTGPGSDLGPGGGYGPGERYDRQRSTALTVAMGERRKNIAVGKLSSGMSKESFDGMQKDWTAQGIDKVISSWRVDMSEMILADKPIPAVIARSIDSNHPTPVTAFVERNVYAEEGRNVLIPAGSRVIGSIGSVVTTTEKTSTSAKIQITWDRLIRPDGSIFVFAGLTGDAQGRGGALGYLDQQLFKRYMLPMMTTTLTSLSTYYMSPGDRPTGETETSKQQAANDARRNFLDQMNSVFEDILNDKASIRPMTYIPAGTRIIIYPTYDLWLRTAERDNDLSANVSRASVFIDKPARDREEDIRFNSGDTGGGLMRSGDVSNSQVVYDQSAGGIEPQRPTGGLVSSNRRNPTTVVPPPPPTYYTPPPASTSSTGTTKPATPSSSSDSSNNTSGVPQLF